MKQSDYEAIRADGSRARNKVNGSRIRHQRAGSLPGFVAIGAGIAIFAVANGLSASSKKKRGAQGLLHDDTPPRAHKDGGTSNWRETTLAGRTVTIRRPRGELYAFWRDFTKLPQFMENVIRVEILSDTRSRWVIAGPGGINADFVAEITEDRKDAVIAWQSEDGAAVRNSGRITFRDAPGGRGTVVDATIAYDAPGGSVGRMIAKAMQREPGVQARRELMRFKQLMEAGEIATARAGTPSPQN